MKKGFLMFRALILVFCLGVTTLPAISQDAQNLPSSTEQPATNKNKLILAFQMLEWQTKHFDDPQQAAEHVKVLKQIQCQVKTGQHNGHTDVSCRTQVWKSLALDADDQVRQWQAWLLAAGFETLHGRPATAKRPQPVAGSPVPEIVKYRLSDWRSQHLHQPQQQSQFIAIYSGLGCETELLDHGNHKDLRIRCVEWMEVELPSHAAAHKWQEFLRNAGFETAHEH